MPHYPLVHGVETDVFADSGYQGVGKREETHEINVNWHVAIAGQAKGAGQENADGRDT